MVAKQLAVVLSVAALGLVLLSSRLLSPSRTELIMPWYEVASSGDGLGPESVHTWAIPPVYHANSFQDPTKWNGDHVLNGGNKEWAEEDAALHAYNMENWRNKIMETQLQRQKKQASIMNVMSDRDQERLRDTRGSQSLAKSQGSRGSKINEDSIVNKVVAKLAGLIVGKSSGDKKVGAHSTSHRGSEAEGSGDTKAALLKVEEENTRVLQRILKKLRRPEHRDGYRHSKSYLRHLERSNRHTLHNIENLLGALDRK
mmetsp:Transcript_22628/g.35403  ORF Transcript_22628/g.35403 Transcript_22628/m.35403 type:complete len:257 (+) Transcript_22628:14-784(+)